MTGPHCTRNRIIGRARVRASLRAPCTVPLIEPGLDTTDAANCGARNSLCGTVALTTGSATWARKERIERVDIVKAELETLSGNVVELRLRQGLREPGITANASRTVTRKLRQR